MSDLKVRIYKGGADASPATTVTIPGGVMKIASKFMPKRAIAALHDEGIDFDELVRLSDDPEAKGVIVDVENHEKGERITVSLE